MPAASALRQRRPAHFLSRSYPDQLARRAELANRHRGVLLSQSHVAIKSFQVQSFLTLVRGLMMIGLRSYGRICPSEVGIWPLPRSVACRGAYRNGHGGGINKGSDFPRRREPLDRQQESPPCFAGLTVAKGLRNEAAMSEDHAPTPGPFRFIIGGSFSR